LLNLIFKISNKVEKIKNLETTLKNAQTESENKTKHQAKKIKNQENEFAFFQESKETMLQKIEDLKTTNKIKTKENEELESEIEINKSNNTILTEYLQ